MSNDYHINLQQEKDPEYAKNEQRAKNFEVQHDIEQIKNNIPYDQNKSKQHQQQQTNSEQHSGLLKFCSLDYYQPFFQVTQQQVLTRIKLSFLPHNSTFIQSLNSNADFYGPFWLVNTFIFFASSTGNLSKYFHNSGTDTYIFKLELIRIAFVLAYSFGFGVPVILYFITKLFGCTQLTLPLIICLYGYSFSCLIPILLLCIIPIQILQWLLISYGIINTSVFLIVNLKSYLNQMLPCKMYFIFSLVFGIQITLFLILKLVFFSKDL